MVAIKKLYLHVFIILVFSILLGSSLSRPAHANGRLIIENPPMPWPQFQPLILEKEEIRTEIDNQVAKTHIRQVWRNNNPMQLEGIFLFPLPSDRATMSDFVLWMDGKKLNFETMEAGKARQIYEDIVRRVRDPGLLEHAGDGLLRCRIFPIPANGIKEIELEYKEVCTKEGTLSRYAFPMAVQGLPRPIGTVLIDVDITSKTAMGRVYSPTHDVHVEMRDSKHARVSFEKSNFTPSSEFVLLISNPDREFGLDLVTNKPSSEDGYFLGLISPRFDYDVTTKKAIPKDFLFILDTSGSMEGEKIQQAKDALRYILRNLNSDDRFGIIAFSTDIKKFKDNLAPQSDSKKALEFVDTLAAAGGTFIDGALKDGLSFAVGSKERPYYIVFLTDGLPTVGEQNIDNILTNVTKANERDARIFSFGVGDDVNIPFIDRLARENGGVASNVAPGQDLEIPVSTLYEKIKSPVLTDIEVSVSGINAYDIYPKDLPDLFKGSQLIVTGRFTGSGNAKITLSGKLAGSDKKTFTYQEDFNAKDENTFIPPLWANRKVGYLLNQIRLYGENQEMIDQVVKLAKRYGIITPYTSYLVLEDQPLPPGGPVPMPFLREGGAGGVAMNMAAPEMQRAVSSELKAKEEAESLDKAGGEGAYGESVKHVEDKTFILKDNYWTDSTYDPEKKLPEIKIEFMGDEYFKLLDKYPEIGKYLAVGENVKLAWKDKVYIITGE